MFFVEEDYKTARKKFEAVHFKGMKRKCKLCGERFGNHVIVTCTKENKV